MVQDNSEDLALLFEKRRLGIAKELNIDLKEPKQDRRIEALQKLYDRYFGKTTTLGFIYSKIIENCDKLIEIYDRKLKEVQDLKDNFRNDLLLKTKLESINFKNQEIITSFEEDILLQKKLLAAYENKYINSISIEDEDREKLKVIEDEAWDNWLKLLDINRELRNSIIGRENRRTLAKVGRAYIDYYMFVEECVMSCFEELKDFRKKGIVEYYETLANFDLPADKLEDFQLFLQKKIESKLDDAVEIKSVFGPFLENSYKQIDDSVNELQKQFFNSKSDLVTMVNYYKNFLLQKQVLFTKDAEDLIFYIKKRYFERIDIFCSSFNKYSNEIKAGISKLDRKDVAFLKKLFRDEFEIHLNKLKIKYSEKFIPLLDSFWHTEKMTEKEYALDRNLFNSYSTEFKKLKIKSMKFLIDKFESEKVKIEKLFENKNLLIEDIGKLGVEEFNKILNSLKKDCEDICAEIISSNHRFWIRANAEFNCEARQHLIRLHYEYAPWNSEWREEGRSWMHDYLVLNTNVEVLKAVGQSLKGYSPESELYLKASEALFKYNEYSRKLFKQRDDVEFNQLMAINTMPEEDVSDLLRRTNEKIGDLELKYKSYWNLYNDFYNFITA